MEDNNKKRPCKFKGMCNNFKRGIDCNFSHDKCPYGQRCKHGDQCRFYHPQNSNQQQLKNNSNINQSLEKKLPVSKTQCKYGLNCKKKMIGQCHFLHSANTQVQPQLQSQTNFQPQYQSQNQSQSLQKGVCRYGLKCNKKDSGLCNLQHINQSSTSPQNKSRICKYGDYCNNYKKGNCTYIHDQNLKQSNLTKPNLPNIFSQRQYQQNQNKICREFMFNRCQEQNCSKQLQHSFAKENKIKRIYYSGTQPLSKMNNIQLFYVDRAIYYVFHQKNRLIFLKYNQIQNRLQYAIENMLQEPSIILKFSIYKSKIIYSTNKQIVIYQPKTGNIVRISNSNCSEVIQLILLNDNTIIFANRKGLTVYKQNKISQQYTKLINQNINNNNQISFIKYFNLLGDWILIAGTKQGIILWNNKLQSKLIKQQNRQYFDGDILIYQNHPYCLITSINKVSKISQTICLDLISLKINIILTLNSSIDNFDKICIFQNLCFISITTGYVYIYNIQTFQQKIGMIIFGNKIIKIQKQLENKRLIILENYDNANQGSFCIFKIN